MSDTPRRSGEMVAAVKASSGVEAGAPPNGLGLALRSLARGAFVDNIALKSVAMVLALTIFVLVHSEVNDVYHTWVSVTYAQESSRVMVSKRVDQVRISVRGSRRRIKRLQKQRLKSIHVDTTSLYNSDLIIEPSMFNLPEGVELISVNPPSLHLEFDAREEKLLSVEVDTIGVPAQGFRLGSAMSSPSEVRVSGARRVLTAVRSIATEKVNLTGRSQSFTGPVALVAGEFEILGSPSVDLNIQIIEELQARELEPIKIAIRLADDSEIDLASLSVLPAVASVTMFGGVRALEAIDAGKIEVFVTVRPADMSLDGPRQLELRVEPTLSDIAYKVIPTHTLLKISP